MEGQNSLAEVFGHDQHHDHTTADVLEECTAPVVAMAAGPAAALYLFRRWATTQMTAKGIANGEQPVVIAA